MAAQFSKLKKFKTIDFEKLFDVCIEAANLSGFKVVDRRTAEGAITLSSPVSLYSWGENVFVQISKFGDLVEVEIKSQCKLRTQIIDWGKNKRNITKIYGYVESLLSKTKD
jgi:hypothetical protein